MKFTAAPPQTLSPRIKNMNHQVNLSTFGAEIGAAYDSVVNPNSKTNWALLGYKNTNDIYVQETGEGGLEELQEEFEDSKMQYAFARVADSTSGLAKFVFISWCGDGVPVMRKALIASHVQDVRSRFKGFHVEISARTENDVSAAVIMKKVRDSSGAKYSHHQQEAAKVSAKTAAAVAKAPVQPPPAVDLARKQREQAERDAAVKKQEEDRLRHEREVEEEAEKQRRVVAEKARLEREQEARAVASKADTSASGSSAPTKVPEMVKEQAKNVRNMWAEREKEVAVSTSNSKLSGSRDGGLNRSQDRLNSSSQDQLSRRREEEKRAADDKMARETEAASVKAKREIDAAKAAKLEQNKREQEDAKREQEKIKRDEEEHQRQQRAKMERESAENARKQEQAALRQKEAEEQEAARKRVETLDITEVVAHVPASSGVSARVLYDYHAAEDNELNLVEGEIITEIDKLDEGWWHGMQSSGVHGLFPANYVEEISAGDTVLVAPAVELPEPVAAPPEPVVPEVAQSTFGFSVRALYDYSASEDNEISFVEGDTIINVEAVTDDWWSGEAHGRVGLFPMNYVERV